MTGRLARVIATNLARPKEQRVKFVVQMFSPAFRPSGNFPVGVFAALLFLEANAISTFILCLVALDLSSFTRDPLLPPVISWCFGPLSS